MLSIADNSLSALAATSRRAADLASRLALLPATAAAAAENAHDRRDAARRHASPSPRAGEGDADGATDDATPASARPAKAPPAAASASLLAATAVDEVVLSQGTWIEHEFGEIIAARQAYERGMIAARVARPTIGLVLDGEF